MVSGKVDMRAGIKNSTVFGALNMLVKCHGEPENHNALHDHGKTTLGLWEIYTATIRKKNGKN